MAAVMPSKFSLLKIEDDSDRDAEAPCKSTPAVDKKKPTKRRKKKKETTLDADLRAMAFGKPCSKAALSGRKNSVSENQAASTANQPDDREWFKRELRITEEAFERDMQEAFLLSQLEAERRQQQATETGVLRSHKLTSSGRSRGCNSLSLQQLQSLSCSQIDAGVNLQHAARSSSNTSTTAAAETADFFQHIDDLARSTVQKESASANTRSDRQSDLQPAMNDDDDDDDGSILAGQNEAVNCEKCCCSSRLLAARTAELQLSRQLCSQLQQQLITAKSRVKRLLELLKDSEVSEKVRLLVSLEKMSRQRDDCERERLELAAQMAALDTQLEQQRSLTHSLSLQLKKATEGKRRGLNENCSDF